MQLWGLQTLWLGVTWVFIPPRFVGLLLVTKLLPAEDTEVALKVWDAIGPRLLRRMLIPVTRGVDLLESGLQQNCNSTYFDSHRFIMICCLF